MSGVFQNIDPPPHPLTARRVCTLVSGDDSLAGWRGGGGSIFWRRQTQLCTLHYICKYFVIEIFEQESASTCSGVK